MSQSSDLIIFARDSHNGGQEESSRSWVLRFPGATGEHECLNTKLPEWRYALRQIRLTGSRSDRAKSIPVIVLPWPSTGRDDDWFVAAKRHFVDVLHTKDPWIQVTWCASEKAEWPGSEEILTLTLSGVARQNIVVCGVTRLPESASRRFWLNSKPSDGPIPHHVWIG